MSLKTATTKTGNGILNFTLGMVTAAHNGPKQDRIDEIDVTIAALKKERARLVEELIES